MTRIIFLLLIYLCVGKSSIAQDSTEIPETMPKNIRPGIQYGDQWIEVHHTMYFPDFLQVAIDSVNGSKVIIKMYGDSIKENGIKKPVDREFRSLLTNRKNIWLVTYVHRIPSVHVHFVIFTTTKGRILKMTDGTTKYSIDSIETIRRMKGTKSIKFINLNSKTERHKF